MQVRLKNIVIEPFSPHLSMIHSTFLLNTIALTYYFAEDTIDQTGQLIFKD